MLARAPALYHSPFVSVSLREAADNTLYKKHEPIQLRVRRY